MLPCTCSHKRPSIKIFSFFNHLKIHLMNQLLYTSVPFGKDSEFVDSAISNLAANFCQYLSLIVSKLLTRDTVFLIKPIQELAYFSQLC